MAEPTPIGIAVLGAGTISQAVHLPAIRRLADRFDLRAVCDLSPSRADFVAGQWGRHVKASATPQEVLDLADVEAVLLATPGTHAPLVRAALEAGKHVLSEKPLCLTVREAEELGALADRLGLVLQIGYMKMYDPLLSVAREACEAMTTPRMVRITVLHPADEPQVRHVRVAPSTDADPAAIADATAYEAERTREALGDVPAELGAYYRNVLQGSVVHELSVLRGLGMSLPVSFDHAEIWPEHRPDGGQASLLATATMGATTRLVVSWNWLRDYPEYAEEVAVFASEARLYLNVAPPYLMEARSSLLVQRAEDGVVKDMASRHGYDTGFVVQLEEFAASVRDGAPIRSDAAGAAADTKCLQGLLTAIAAHQGIKVAGEAGQQAIGAG